ncbi:sensor histidine kinase [Oscillibacter sp. MSJ-2]|uniref:Sensor histidine kinase n=1 Tax=Dysosmobacter acutus TaxID=2841504 RepID=A0ABS6F604_9FIRM|nr:sensor histidine kinase [Dysosmobacter acutus]MBU5625695.1 sensor histidine kinase [Dysosmobacter acutus]
MEEKLLAELLPGVAAQLRGAMGTMGGALENIAPPELRAQNPALDAEAAKLYQAYYRLVRLVINLSEADSMESANPLPLKNYEIVRMVQDLYWRVKPQADLLGLEFQFTCRESEHVVAMNQRGLDRMVLNLLSNAFKFTPKGGNVVMDLKFVRRMGILSISDNGTGINEERMETLFCRYTDTNRMEPYPHGMGLGLPVCRRIARGLGGSLLVESKEGLGTRVTCSFPDRRVNMEVSDSGADYTGGKNPTLVELADALPEAAFSCRNMD